MSDLKESNFHSELIKKRKKLKQRQMIQVVGIYCFIIVLIGVVAFGTYQIIKAVSGTGNNSGQTASQENNPESQTQPQISDEEEIKALIQQADRLAAGYDYDKAIELLSSDARYTTRPEITAAIAGYEETKTTLVKADVTKVPHVFFHTLIYDKSKAFDGDDRQMGYNQVMTTIGEFEKMLDEMYKRGCVLVKIHDVGYESTDSQTGETKMVKGDIMLPPGKKPIVMSQDDVNYYPYMQKDGFANRLVIGDDGRVTCEMDLDDGSKVRGDYDLIPILNKFIDAHPDFSYRGAKAIIAVTGYEGVYGYRTTPSYEGKNPNIESDKQTVREIAEALKKDGWELASHSWGHKHLGRIDMDHFKADCDKWNNEVNSLIGPVDILLYPFGTDVADWHPYKADNERYKYMYNLGFRYFCTVDSSEYWVQFGTDNLRMGRRNLDGYRMKTDIDNPDKAKLTDLFDPNEVYDKSRPAEMGVITS